MFEYLEPTETQMLADCVMHQLSLISMDTSRDQLFNLDRMKYKLVCFLKRHAYKGREFSSAEIFLAELKRAKEISHGFELTLARTIEKMVPGIVMQNVSDLDREAKKIAERLEMIIEMPGDVLRELPEEINFMIEFCRILKSISPSFEQPMDYKRYAMA